MRKAKCNQFIKNLYNPADFILGVLNIDNTDKDLYKIFNIIQRNLSSIFNILKDINGSNTLAMYFKLDQKTLELISSNLSTAKMIEVELETMMLFGEAYSKLLKDNINSIDINIQLAELYQVKDNLSSIEHELEFVCSNKETRKLIVDILSTLVNIVLTIAEKEGGIDMKNIKANNNRDMINEIIKESNLLDDTNVKINLDGDNDHEFNNILEIYKNFINELISRINHVDVKMLDTYDVNDIEFKNSSSLFKTNERLDMNSELFKYRFMTMMMSYTTNRVSKLALVLEEGYNSGLRNSLVNSINMFIKYLGDGLNSNESHYTMLKVLMGSKGTDETMIRNQKTLDKLDEFIKVMSEKHVNKELEMNVMIRLAYMLTTINDSANLDYDDDFNINNSDDIKKVISILGKAIDKRMKSGVMNKMFDFFNKSNPKIYTKLKDLDRDAIIGCRALAFTKFILQNKKINKSVDKLLLA